MKKLFAIIMSALMLVCFMPTMAFADPPAGSGTSAVTAKWEDAVASQLETGYAVDDEAKTMTISSVEGLVWFAKQANGTAGSPANDFANYTVTLTDNINLSGKDWTPIANFAGTFNGNNKTISGLSVKSTSSTTDVNSEATSGAGLFAYLNGSVNDLTIDKAVIDLSAVDDAQNVGVLAGRAEYKIFTNVKITNATITTDAKYVGGLIGFGYGNISGCEVSESVITGKAQVGGLVGYHKLIKVQNNNLNNNKITATEERAGGIFGKLQVVLGDLGSGTATLSGCTVSGGSATAPDYAGGIAGQLMGAGDGDDTNRYIMSNNKVENFTLDAEEEKSAFATIRDGAYPNFLGALNTNVAGNTLEDISRTLDETWKTKTDYTNFTVYERCVAQIDDVKYTTLNAAIEAATDGDTVNILKDCTIAPVKIGYEEEWQTGIIIEGNNYTVTGWDKGTESTNGGYNLAIDVYSRVNFDKIQFENFSCGEESTDMKAAIINGYDGCDIKITNCSFKKFNRQAIHFAPDNGESMTVENSKFYCAPLKPEFLIQKAFMIAPGNKGSSVVIKNCEIFDAGGYNDKGWSAGGIEIYGGTLSVEDCTITNCEVGIFANREYWDSGNINLDIKTKNTSISAWDTAVWLSCYKNRGTNTTASIEIESGYYKGVYETVAFGKMGWTETNMGTDEDLKSCSISLTGGYYSAEPAAKYVAGGYYVDASNISSYPYVVKQGTKPDGAFVVIEGKTTPSISEDNENIKGLTEEDTTAIRSKTEVQGVTEAVAGSKNVLVEKSGINTTDEGVDKVNVDVDVKVELTAADLNAANKTMTYTATPVATVTTTDSDGATKETKTDIAVPNSLLSGELMTVKLPLPENFELKQIKHTSSDGSVEYFLETSTRGANTFDIDENNCAVFTISKFSTFELSGAVTYVAPSGGYYKPADTTDDDTKTDEKEDTEKDTAAQIAKVKELAGKIQLKARSVKTAKGNIKVRLKITKGADSFKALEDMGYTLKYQFYRSTEMRKNYKYKFETLGAPYTNTDAKKGNRYYYKARIVVYDEEGNLITKTDLKKCWYATRIR